MPSSPRNDNGDDDAHDDDDGVECDTRASERVCYGDYHRHRSTDGSRCVVGFSSTQVDHGQFDARSNGLVQVSHINDLDGSSSTGCMIDEIVDWGD